MKTDAELCYIFFNSAASKYEYQTSVQFRGYNFVGFILGMYEGGIPVYALSEWLQPVTRRKYR